MEINEPAARGRPEAVPDAALVLSKAVVRAAEPLRLSQGQLAQALGLRPVTASRLHAGHWLLAPDSKPWELAALLVRAYRSLDAITGGRIEAMQAWLHSENAALGAVPAQRLVSCEGLIDVLHDLNASRSRIRGGHRRAGLVAGSRGAARRRDPGAGRLGD